MKNRDDASFGDNDEIPFADEAEAADAFPPRGLKPWKIVIVDDEPDVHTITRMAMEGETFEGRPMEFFSAYSARDARTLLGEHPDAAVVLLDVVMEAGDSGLVLIRYIREILRNRLIRIILRTGRPGEAPQRRVIAEYDINDYKEKSELTVQKLYSSIITAIRSFRDLRTIDRNRRGLERIIRSSARLFEVQSLKSFAQGVLIQLLSILNLDESSLYVQASGFTAACVQEEVTILAGTGEYEDFVNRPVDEVVSPEVSGLLETAMSEKISIFDGGSFVGYFPTDSGPINLLYLKGYQDLSDLDRDLIRIFSTNVAIAFENIYLNREIMDTQKEIILTLGEVVEKRSREMANHVRRVAETSYLLALKCGLDEESAEMLRLASPMHDVGKVGIPDAILMKPGALTPEEFQQIIPHTTIGFRILRKSRRDLMAAAAIVAQQHHERWDGTGYPQGLKGEEIHIFGRITGLADVFDALSHRRIYKEAWVEADVIDLIRRERGRHFDPGLVDLLLSHMDEFIDINGRYPDRPEATDPSPAG